MIRVSRKRLLMTVIRAGIALLLLLLPVVPGAQAADFLTASGCSVSNVGYLSDLAREYERRKGVKIYVRGGGSVVGIEDLRSGKVDFAAACRNREPGDPDDLQFVQVAWDALAFIVHKSNRVDSITVDQARAIYAGQLKNWSELGGANAPIKVFVSRPRRGLSGVESSMRAMILKGREPAVIPTITQLASTGIVEQMVEDTPEGFATTGFTSGRKRNVKMLKVSGVSPSVRTIVSRKYPLKRPLFILVPRQHKPEVQHFVDFVLSREGQNYIKSLGVVSLTDIP